MEELEEEDEADNTGEFREWLILLLREVKLKDNVRYSL